MRERQSGKWKVESELGADGHLPIPSFEYPEDALVLLD